jgi:methylated-DNA-[protein]-cysteine S-methyltransferase
LQLSSSSSKRYFLENLKKRVRPKLIHDPNKFFELKKMLNTWHEGKAVKFDLSLDLRGTEFQEDVWKAIHAIPWGRLTSYGRIAKSLGRPKAARAVGNAVGSNPISIVIPCHRVIWSNGGLGGFGRGFDPARLDIKRRYLFIEGILPRVNNLPEKEVDLTRFFI